MPIERTAGGGTTITGKAMNLWYAASIKSGIGLYLKTGIKARRDYTPTNMRLAAGQITGKVYAKSRKGLETALADLTTLLDEVRNPDAVPGPN